MDSLKLPANKSHKKSIPEYLSTQPSILLEEGMDQVFFAALCTLHHKT